MIMRLSVNKNVNPTASHTQPDLEPVSCIFIMDLMSVMSVCQQNLLQVILICTCAGTSGTCKGVKE